MMIKQFPVVIRQYFSLILVFLILISAILTASADSGKDSISYKLAILAIKEEKPEDAFLKKRIEPPAAVVSEFQWILDSLKTRCLNPETAIADTIVETWSTLKKNGKTISLLETARELSKTAKNAKLYGTEKVNFRMTSNYWLKQKLPTTK